MDEVSRAKLEAYRRFVDVFFDGAIGRNTELHAIVVDTHRLNHRAHNDGSPEVGFNKEIYQLCSKFARLHSRRMFHVYLDSRTTHSDPEDLRLILNRGRRKVGDARDWPFRRVHFRQSHEWQTMQLVDLLIGALAFRLNGHNLQPGASVPKSDLSDHILRRAGVLDVTADTAMAGKFTIWHRQLR